jgi:polyisoprenoid-binding protein YceI
MAVPKADTVHYQIDTRTSQFTVQAFASGLISAVAHSPKIAIRDWTGDIETTGDHWTDSSLKVRINARSLEVLDELRDTDRRELHRVMNEEVLHSKAFPEIFFESETVEIEKLNQGLYRVRVKGQLRLHGITNPQTVEAQLTVGADTARAHGDFKFKQSHFEIPIASIAGGTLKLQDELKVSFYVVARKVTDKSQAHRAAGGS